MDSSAAGLAGLGFFGGLFVLLLAVLWILVPFAIFGIKPRLSALLKEQERTNEILVAIGQEARAARAAPTLVQDAEPLASNQTLGEMIASKRT